MKRTLLPASLIASLLVSTAWIGTAQAATDLKNKDDKVSYSMGLVFGQRMQANLPELKMDAFVEGMRDGYDKTAKPKMTEDEVRTTLQEFQQAERKKQMEQFKKLADENKKKSEAFLKANAKKAGVKTTDSGLQYEVLKKGTGPAPKPGDKVTVNYTGTLIDGKVFDSSRERGKPVTFELTDVIPGWTEGLQLMHQGGHYKLFIPSDLAYGPGGNRSIGPNEALIFDIDLIKVEAGSSKKGDAGKKE
ncbi:FKBP-type peptidyl-prolyl cis-trans isomerase [Mangrovitalea sediminis]|uniref:FKBP-type peptidyl-prolyl cis-trans isomerase n=1 Tax=Mangrovitalea sediminis TaxID=1982043 RepID=UPI000BE58A96|nr:FKBP-type peptidyl-prolyl cis-trans isomerase [Mangrovitalea sediminis]